MNDKLRPCPFCGGKGEIKFDVGDYRTGEYRGYYVMCGNSDVNCLAGWISGGCFATKEEAVEAWNRRDRERQAYFKGYLQGTQDSLQDIEKNLVINSIV